MVVGDTVVIVVVEAAVEVTGGVSVIVEVEA